MSFKIKDQQKVKQVLTSYYNYIIITNPEPYLWCFGVLQYYIVLPFTV